MDTYQESTTEIMFEEVEKFAPDQLDAIKAKVDAQGRAHRFPDGTTKYTIDFGYDSRWTVIYSPLGRPLRCEHNRVRFERSNGQVLVAPAFR